MKNLHLIFVFSIIAFTVSCSTSRNPAEKGGSTKTKITGVRPNVRNPSTGVINATGDNLTPGINSVNRNGAGSEENASAIANNAINKANSELKNPKVIQDVPAIEKQLTGKWKYSNKSGGFAGKKEVADPKSPEILEFKTGLNFIRTQNGKVTEQGTYEIVRIKSIYSGKEENAVRFNQKPDRPQMAHIIVIKEDSLILADNVYDGFTTTYTRQK